MLSSMIKDITEHHWQQSFQFVLMRYVSRNVFVISVLRSTFVTGASADHTGFCHTSVY